MFNLSIGDAATITLTSSAYPYAPNGSTSLQSRIVSTDAAGIAFVSNGGLIMPSVRDSDYLSIDPIRDRYWMVPWHGVRYAVLLARRIDYEAAWERTFAHADAYAEKFGPDGFDWSDAYRWGEYGIGPVGS